MHGQFCRNLDEQLVAKEQSYRWDMKAETGSTVVAAEDQTLCITAVRKKF